MSAPYRITRPSVAQKTLRAAEAGGPAPGGPVAVAGPTQGLQGYLDRLMKMIPGEAIGLYLVGSGFIPQNQAPVLAIWAVVCLFGVIALKAYGTADQAIHLPPDWTHVGISAVAFVIWVYSIGGPFAAYGIAVPYIGSLLVLAWTFFVPIFYQGPAE